jgi:hypothetical protein
MILEVSTVVLYLLSAQGGQPVAVRDFNYSWSYDGENANGPIDRCRKSIENSYTQQGVVSSGTQGVTLLCIPMFNVINK